MADPWLWFLPCCFTSLWIYIISFIVLAYSLSSTFRFYTKVLILGLYYCFMFVITFVLTIPTPRSKNNLHKVCKFAKWTEPMWGIKYNVKGLENYKKDTNYIIVSNHQSSFDMNVLSNIIPPYTTFLSKKDVLYLPVLGQLLWLAGVFFINRNNHMQAMNTMGNVADEIKKEKVFVFTLYNLSYIEGSATEY